LNVRRSTKGAINVTGDGVVKRGATVITNAKGFSVHGDILLSIFFFDPFTSY